MLTEGTFEFQHFTAADAAEIHMGVLHIDGIAPVEHIIALHIDNVAPPFQEFATQQNRIRGIFRRQTDRPDKPFRIIFRIFCYVAIITYRTQRIPHQFDKEKRCGIRFERQRHVTGFSEKKLNQSIVFKGFNNLDHIQMPVMVIT